MERLIKRVTKSGFQAKRRASGMGGSEGLPPSPKDMYVGFGSR